MSDQTIEVQGLRIKAHDLGDGTYAICTSSNPPGGGDPTDATAALVAALVAYEGGVYTVGIDGGAF